MRREVCIPISDWTYVTFMCVISPNKLNDFTLFIENLKHPDFYIRCPQWASTSTTEYDVTLCLENNSGIITEFVLLYRIPLYSLFLNVSCMNLKKIRRNLEIPRTSYSCCLKDCQTIELSDYRAFRSLWKYRYIHIYI